MVPSGAAGRAGSTAVAPHCGGVCGLGVLRQAEKAWAAEKAALRREAMGEHKRANALDRELSAVRDPVLLRRAYLWWWRGDLHLYGDHRSTEPESEPEVSTPGEGGGQARAQLRAHAVESKQLKSALKGRDLRLVDVEARLEALQGKQHDELKHQRHQLVALAAERDDLLVRGAEPPLPMWVRGETPR